MNKTETIAAGVKAAYVRPRIACYATEFDSSLCAGTTLPDVGHNPVLPDPKGDLEEDD